MHGRCLGPTRSQQGKVEGTTQWRFCWPEPGVQGAAATGRPLCAPCAMSDITQKKYRERNQPGNSTGVVALLSAARAGAFPVAPSFRRVAAGALTGLRVPLTDWHIVGPVSAAPPGDGISYGPALVPGGGWRLNRPTVRVMYSPSPSPRRREGVTQALALSSRATCSALRLSAAARAKLST